MISTTKYSMAFVLAAHSAQAIHTDTADNQIKVHQPLIPLMTFPVGETPQKKPDHLRTPIPKSIPEQDQEHKSREMKRGTPITKEDAKMMQDRKNNPVIDSFDRIKVWQETVAKKKLTQIELAAQDEEFRAEHAGQILAEKVFVGNQYVAQYAVLDAQGFKWGSNDAAFYSETKNPETSKWVDHAKNWINTQDDGIGDQEPMRYSKWFTLADKLDQKMRRSGFLWLSGKHSAFKTCSDAQLKPVRDAFKDIKEHRSGRTSDNRTCQRLAQEAIDKREAWSLGFENRAEKKCSYSKTNRQERVELLQTWYDAFKVLAGQDRDKWAVFVQLVRDVNQPSGDLDGDLQVSYYNLNF
jgi:hypothetical protein